MIRLETICRIFIALCCCCAACYRSIGIDVVSDHDSAACLVYVRR